MNRGLPVLEAARGFDPWNLGTRMAQEFRQDPLSCILLVMYGGACVVHKVSRLHDAGFKFQVTALKLDCREFRFDYSELFTNFALKTDDFTVSVNFLRAVKSKMILV